MGSIFRSCVRRPQRYSPDDSAAQEWIVDALVTLDALYQVMKSVALPPPATPAFEFSMIEALYARGFTSAARITELSSDQFEEALIGTVAHDIAGAIYTSASAIAPPTPVPPPPGAFAPVNPDGSLTNCVPRLARLHSVRSLISASC